MNSISTLSLILACSTAAASTLAATTICKVQGDPIAPKAISWIIETGQAKVQLSFGDPIEGRIAMMRPHDPYGSKVNLIFPLTDRLLADELEFIVFPTSKTEYRIIGVGYRVIGGIRTLNNSLGNYGAQCNTL